MRGLAQDVRYGFRQWRRRPAWTLAIILVLALGIGANTAMFSGFEAWVLRPLDFAAPQDLVVLNETQPKLDRITAVSPANLGDWKAQQNSFQDLGAFRRRKFNLDDESEPARIDGTKVSASLLPLLGKPPVRGRAFRENEDLPGAPAAVAMISHRLWRERFQGDSGIVSRTVRLDGVEHEIVGVMEPGFAFPEWADVWTPLGADIHSGNRANRSLSVVGRLAPGVGIERAQAEMEAIADRLAAEYPHSNEGWSVSVRPLREGFVPEVIRVALFASLISGILVLLVICANVASLMLAQASGRTLETAIRAALGARRRRLARQNLVEGLLLALPSAGIGFALGWLGVRWVLSWVPVDPPYLFRMSLSLQAGLYTLGAAVLAGAVCGLAPVIRHAGVNTCEALKSGGARAAGGASSLRMRALLVGGELALSTALLVGALLMVKSFLSLQSVEKGFRTEGLLTADVSVSDAGLDRAEVVRRLQSELEGVSGAESVGIASNLPVSRNYLLWSLVAEGQVRYAGEDHPATVQSIAGDYLETMGIPLLAGRRFTDGENYRGGAVALVSRGLARRLWKGDDVLGRRLRSAAGRSKEDWLRVVGVVGDVDYGQDMVVAGTIPESQLYLPYARLESGSIAVAVRFSGTRARVAADLREAFRRAAPGVPASQVLTMEESIFRSRWTSRFFSRQLSLYALLATLIAGLGLYGLTADSVASRSKELAIRMALGARRPDLLRLVLRQALASGSVGILAGLLLADWLADYTAPMLTGIDSAGAGVFLGVAGALFAVTLLASLFPARKATALDPIEALRSE